MCWLLVAVAVVALVGVGQLHPWLLLLLAAVAVEVGVGLNYGFLLSLLALLKQSLSAQAVPEALPKHQTILTALPQLKETPHRLGLGRLLGVEQGQMEAQQHPELPEVVVAAWEKLLQVQLHTPQVEALETQQTEELRVVEAIDPGVVAVLRDLQQMQLMVLTGNLAGKAAHF
jgi:hypothetical protein